MREKTYSDLESEINAPYKYLGIEEDDFINASVTVTNFCNLNSKLSLNMLLFFIHYNLSLPKIFYLRKDIPKDVYNVYSSYGDGSLNIGEDGKFKEISSMNEIIEHIHDIKKFTPKCTIYNCTTPQELFVSMLHYYLSNNYKIKKCSLCEKPFITITDRKKFCDRKSHIPKYSRLTCAEAQQRIRKNNGVNDPLKRRYNVMLSTFDRLRETKNGDKYMQIKRDFMDTAKELRETKTYEEYSEWLTEQEQLYKPRQYKKKEIK